MSVNIVLPDLPTWVEGGISAIYMAKTEEQFNEAFDHFIAEKVSIRVNGKHMSRDEYKKQLQGEGFLEAGADVTFNGVVEIPNDQANALQVCTVLLYVITHPC